MSRVTHLLVVPSTAADLRTYCGVRASEAGPSDYITAQPAQVDCERCLTNARATLENLGAVFRVRAAVAR